MSFGSPALNTRLIEASNEPPKVHVFPTSADNDNRVLPFLSVLHRLASLQCVTIGSYHSLMVLCGPSWEDIYNVGRYTQIDSNQIDLPKIPPWNFDGSPIRGNHKL